MTDEPTTTAPELSDEETAELIRFSQQAALISHPRKRFAVLLTLSKENALLVRDCNRLRALYGEELLPSYKPSLPSGNGDPSLPNKRRRH
jgi:hypothetical protein